MLGIFDASHIFIVIFNLYALYTVYYYAVIKGVNILKDMLFEFIIMLWVGMYLVVGFINGYSLYNIAIDVYRIIIFFIIILVFKNLNYKTLLECMPSNRFLYVFFVIISVFVLLLFSRFIIIGDIYPNFMDIHFLFPLSYFIAANFTALIAVSFAIILISGSRTVLLATTCLLLLLNIKKWHTWVFILIVGVILFFVYNWSDSSVIVYMPAIGKFNALFNALSSEQTNVFNIIKMAFPDRASEVISLYKEIRKDTFTMIFGLGPGLEYTWYDLQGGIYEVYHRGAHFSPIIIWAHYGLIFMMVLYLYLIYVLQKAIHIAWHSKDKMLRIFAIFNMSFFFTQFTLYSVFISFLYAISCGVLLRGNILTDKEG